MKKDPKFKDIFSHRLDWCSIIGVTKTNNYLGRIVLASVKGVKQNVTVPCPLNGYYGIFNLMPIKAFIGILPAGEIRIAAVIELPDCGAKIFLKYFAEFYD